MSPTVLVDPKTLPPYDEPDDSLRELALVMSCSLFVVWSKRVSEIANLSSCIRCLCVVLFLSMHANDSVV